MIKPGFYRHFKGGYVLVLTTAKHSDREEVEVIYIGLNNGKFYARPIESFTETVKNENNEEVLRFTAVSNEEVKDLLNENITKLYNVFI